MSETSTDMMPNTGSEDPLAHLQWYLDSGVDECMGEVSVDRFALSEHVSSPAEKPPSDTGQPSSSGPIQKPRAAQMVPNEQIIDQAKKLAQSCNSLSELEAALKDFNGCSLKKTATHTLFADGNPDSSIMVIGDAPGAEDDRKGKVFCGPGGDLLDKMFGAINLNRQDHLYLTHLLPWRPPGNRKPTDSEVAICLPFIRRHIELFNPQLIILMGGLPASSLLGEDLTITRLRGKWKKYPVMDKDAPAMALYHPAYLLRQPQGKADAWKDLLAIKARLEENK